MHAYTNTHAYIYTQLDAHIHDYIYQKQKIYKLYHLVSIYFILYISHLYCANPL